MKKSICILLSAFLTLSALPLNTFANDKIIANESKNGTNTFNLGLHCNSWRC